MELRKFGKTDLYVTPIVFGAWEIGGKPFFTDMSKNEAVKLVRTSIESGINFIDTAPVYGFGHSERIISQAIKDMRDKIVISTKCGLRWTDESISSIYKNASRKSILEEIALSLKRLDADYIDLYLVHWPDTDTKTPISETIETLEEIKKAGKIRYYGLSNFNTDQMKEAARYGDISGLQSQYNMLCLDLEKNELPYCRENNIGFQAYSPLHRGILADKTIESLKETKQPAISWIMNRTEKKQIEKVQRIKDISKKYGVPLAGFVLSWTISQPDIATTLIGTTKIDHIEDAIKSTEVKITEEDNIAIRKILESD